ncbi:MAG: HIRAN domain-containing protein [Deferrisomatales bacterium]|nr:HIRAN domain-containing protein [Deferrisomatales bacterium]
MNTLFVAWQDPANRAWFPVGRLTREAGVYQFVYLVGALRAEKQAGFDRLAGFPSFDRVYEAANLFPLFTNRLPPRSRPEYGEFVRWLNVPDDEDDPIVLLARSGGRRATDSLEVYPCPEPDEEARYHIHFVVHGLRHLPEASIERVERLEPGERLFLMHDLQNPKDPKALLLRTGDRGERDVYPVGYCPRYLAEDLHGIWEKAGSTLSVAVERVNPAPAPLQLRLLCNLTSLWPAGFKPFSGDIYEPIPDDVATACVA